jgi:hypothetical protein
MTKVGIGCGNDLNTFELGRSIAREALQSGDMAQADIVIAFSSGYGDLEQFYAGIRSIVGDSTPIIGGASIGIITHDLLSYHGVPAAAAAISSDSIRFAISSAGGMDQDEGAAGISMMNNLQISDDDRAMLLFYDSIRVAAGPANPPVLSSSAPLLDAVERRLSGRVPVYGAGLIGGYGFGHTSQFCGSKVDTQQSVGCMISGDAAVYHTVMHGCIPMNGIYHTITRMKDDVIYELDGQPVVALIDDLFGSNEWQQDRPVVSNLAIGINHGDRFGAPEESNYANRLITGVIPDGSGIGMFEADLHTGQEVQFMVRDNRMIKKSVQLNAPAILERIRGDGRNPLFALYIDCGGRSAEFSTTEEDEAAVVQQVMRDAGVPLLGFYTGVEIAPMMGRSRGLDWTGVLMILAGDN